MKFFLKISLKSEISKKHEKMLLSDLLLLDSALIFTFSVKFLLKTEVSLKIGTESNNTHSDSKILSYFLDISLFNEIFEKF